MGGEPHYGGGAGGRKGGSVTWVDWVAIIVVPVALGGGAIWEWWCHRNRWCFKDPDGR